MNTRQSFELTIFTTLVLWFTGVITVPFSNRAAQDWLVLIGVDPGPSFNWLSFQLENLVYTFGRIPILFSAYVAYGIWTGRHK